MCGVMPISRSLARIAGSASSQFPRCFDEWDISDVEEQGIVVTGIEGEFANGFQNGRPSMSPVVPPISVMMNIRFGLLADLLMRFEFRP